MDELEELRRSIRKRKEAQNARRAKAGKPPMHPELLKPKKSKAAVPPPAESGLEEDSALSFDEWKAQGWAVKKGAKASRFGMDGTPEFTRTQVRRDNPAWNKYRQRR
jgi:hypothetical protein